VVLEVEGRQSLRLLMKDISKGGLFIETDTPPDLESEVHVTIYTPDGKVKVVSTVVYTCGREEARKFGRVAGAGLMFVYPNDEAIQSIEKYIDGLKERFTHTIALGIELDFAMKEAGFFLDALDARDYYSALRVEPLEKEPQIRKSTSELMKVFTTDQPAATDEQNQYLNRAMEALMNVQGALVDPRTRMDYDFQSGHIFAKQRIKACRRDPEVLSGLRAAWERNFPGQIRASETQASFAQRHEEVGELEASVSATEAALLLDPFNIVLADKLDERRSKISRTQGLDFHS
jgi:Tfp pilus assembly protein PilZ